MTEKPFSREHLISPVDRDKMFMACQNMAERAMYVLIAWGGMRESEASHARATWWNGHALKVPKREECDCNDCRKRGYWKPKSKRGARTIPIRGFYRPFLTSFFKASPVGLGMGRITVWRRVKALARRAGLDPQGIFPHAFRATLASEFVAAFVDRFFIQEFFGWASIETADSYVNVSEKLNAELRDKGLL